jgi:hypothetical protein
MQVKRAMNEINKAKRLRVAAIDEGEAIKIRAVKEAEAEASRTEIQAKADAEAKFLAGNGIARQRQAIMDGLRDSVNDFKTAVDGIDAKTVMDLMIVTQYFDMMKEVGAQSKTNAVFMNHSPGALEDIAQAVSKGFLTGASRRALAHVTLAIPGVTPHGRKLSRSFQTASLAGALFGFCRPSGRAQLLPADVPHVGRGRRRCESARRSVTK